MHTHLLLRLADIVERLPARRYNQDAWCEGVFRRRNCLLGIATNRMSRETGLRWYCGMPVLSVREHGVSDNVYGVKAGIHAFDVSPLLAFAMFGGSSDKAVFAFYVGRPALTSCPKTEFAISVTPKLVAQRLREVVAEYKAAEQRERVEKNIISPLRELLVNPHSLPTNHPPAGSPIYFD